MPLCQVRTSAPVDGATAANTLVELSAAVAELLHKPEDYVLTTIDQAAMCMGGEISKAAYVDLRSIGGLTPATNRALSKQLCEILHRRLGVAHDHIFITFTHVEPSCWGHDGGTFG